MATSDNVPVAPSESLAPVVRLEDVHVVFGSTLALDVESLRIAPGERVFVLGRSGSGKTTLSRLIKGRLAPTTGSISVLGENPADPDPRVRRGVQRRIAMIDQDFHLVPRTTVADNVLMGALGRTPPLRSLFGWYPRAELAAASAVLEEVDLSECANRRVDELSGGQRQRTAIGRALMQEASVIVADEPVSNLDPELAEDALELLVDCLRRRAATLVVNLHQPSLARRFATRIIGLAGGRVVYDGPPASFDEAAAGFLYHADGGRVVPMDDRGRGAGTA